MTLLEGGNIANVERIKVVTIEATPKTYVFETTTSATFTAALSAGAETELRVKNTMHGLLRTEDLVKGYDLELQDQKLLPQIFALVDGGVYTAKTGVTGDKYEAPVAGASVNRTKFDTYLYTSDRDSDGDALAYHEWKFPSCKGKPVDGSFKDGEFATNTYKLASRPAKGVSPMVMQRIDALPEVV
ncbi:MAG: hypothetical protein RR296_01120 [Clostridia bacterium]